MKRADWMQRLVLILPLCLLTATSAWAKTKKATPTTGTAEKKTTVEKDKPDKDKDEEPLFPEKNGEDAKKDFEIHPDLAEFYAEVAEVTRLDEEGQKKLLAIQEKKNKALEKFDAKNDRMVARIENEMDRTDKEKKREKLRARLKEIEKERRNIQWQADNLALRVLNAEQRVTWNTHELWEVVSPELEFEDDLALTDEQVEKSRAVCSLIAKKTGAKGRIAQNPSVQRTAITQIGRQVLNKKQRVAYTRKQRRKRLYEEDGDKKKKIRRGGR